MHCLSMSLSFPPWREKISSKPLESVAQGRRSPIEQPKMTFLEGYSMLLNDSCCQDSDSGLDQHVNVLWVFPCHTFFQQKQVGLSQSREFPSDFVCGIHVSNPQAEIPWTSHGAMECKNRRTGEGVARDAASSAAKVLYTLEKLSYDWAMAMRFASFCRRSLFFVFL